MLFKELHSYCESLGSEFDLIPQERKDQLTSLSNYISGKIDNEVVPQITIICTHNSRRSHLGQLWLAVGKDFYNLPEIQSFSGGTEATAFNINAVNALRKAGFQVHAPESNTSNPAYEVSWKEDMEPYQAFSKKFEDAPNPKQNFAAVMVCSEADEGCPFVPGSDFRLSLPYDDPKAFDGTDLEAEKYDERCRQIGREMLFALSQIK